MKKILYKTVDIICIILELAFTIISLPFRAIKACFDIVKVIKAN